MQFDFDDKHVIAVNKEEEPDAGKDINIDQQMRGNSEYAQRSGGFAEAVEASSTWELLSHGFGSL